MPEQLDFLSAQPSQLSSRCEAALLIRESGRARRMYLHVVPPLDIEVVVPRGTKVRTVEAFVAANTAWIAKARAEIDAQYIGDRSLFPDSIVLKSDPAEFAVNYNYAPTANKRYLQSGNRLTVNCRESDLGDSGLLLRAWIIAKGRKLLIPRLLAIARQIGDMPKRVQVRLQRTRWGSCSATGTISLNAGLLFLEPELASYLMVHELCHIRHMNHSRRFWQHVSCFEPDWQRLDRQLSQSWKQIPYWAVTR